MITKDLGMVTAYAYAVSKGYTGTEEEFAELMASYASVAQEAVDAALAAAQSAQAAESAKDTAQTTVDGAIAGIQAEGQTQIGAVQSEGTTQVGNVNSAGTTQVDAVQAKGAEVLDSIPSDYTALSGEVSGLKSASNNKAYGEALGYVPSDLMISQDAFVDGGFNGSGGTYGPASDTAFMSTHKRINDYFALQQDHDYIVVAADGYISLVCLYDADKTFIERSVNTQKVTIPAGTASYIRLGVSSDNAFDKSDAYKYLFVTFGEPFVSKSNLISVDDRIDMLVDSSDIVSDFSETTAANGTYYSGGVKEWGTALTRIINTTTLSYPINTRITANPGYFIYAYILDHSYTFTGNQAAPAIRTSGDFVSSFDVAPYENILLVVRNSSNTAISPTEWESAVKIEAYPYDLMELTKRIDALTPFNSDYTVDGRRIDTSNQMYEITKLAFSPVEGTGKYVQGVAVYGGVIFQGFGNGVIDLYNYATGELINSYTLAESTHCGSLSFGSDFYDVSDEFPLLYVASGLSETTYIYRISRTNCVLIKTISFAANNAGYLQNGAISKDDGTYWIAGYENNDYNAGGKIIISHWDITGAEPELIDNFMLPHRNYMQFAQFFNGQFFVGFGSDGTSAGMESYLLVICGGEIVSTIKSLPDVIKNAEFEGIDFVLNATEMRYSMLWAQRFSAAYYLLDFT